jgi:hypothetical protein
MIIFSVAGCAAAPPQGPSRLFYRFAPQQIFSNLKIGFRAVTDVVLKELSGRRLAVPWLFEHCMNGRSCINLKAFWGSARC